MNTLHIIGNLTANPKSRVVNTANGTSSVCDFTVATNRYVKGKKVACRMNLPILFRLP